ncbi:MAG: single-stranded DNA-binding protein [Methylacidiphilales bacterium]|nr:single-stranded DNA-binding protein [Candidatus Methylacidiphilales bacterium]
MYNKIKVVGRVGNDPEIRYTQTGTPFTNLSVATTRTWNQDGNKKSETTWFQVLFYGSTAENICQYLKKGSLILVEGRILPDPKTGNPVIYKRKDGTIGASFVIVASTVRFLSKKSDRDNEESEIVIQSDGDIENEVMIQDMNLGH